MNDPSRSCANAGSEPTILLSSGTSIPQLAFGMYKILNNDSGLDIVQQAITTGYRHFDTATFYENESVLGRALSASGLPRHDFCIASKVWKDAIREGRVRESVLQSIQALNFGDYIDIYYIHWPVPGHFVQAYRELETLVREGKIRAIGLSNFNINDYHELERAGMSISPVVNQFEVSPVLYRPQLIEFFLSRNIAVAASKALNRAACLTLNPIANIAKRHGITPAQVLLRWSLQKGLVVVSKTSTPRRMQENRAIVDFALTEKDMAILDSLTLESIVHEREALEEERKRSD